ncbi:MAG: response regulator transcription factor [Prochloraceae cyanobacterium]|nr:response regulator transcription factor [Prochloraceae cyanobacterium]
MNRILIAEDEANIVSFLEKALRKHGFTTTSASKGQDALELALSSNFDLLILDLGLPDKDGLEVLAELRGQGQTLPIIILTARDDINDKVCGLEGGANDYITKPFRFEELLARVRVQFRHLQESVPQKENILRASNVSLDLRARQAKVEGELVELSAKEFFLAEIFLRHPGKVFSREELLDRVWGYDYDPSSNVVDVYVGHLRKKLGNDLIETVRGMGYKLQV